jgi:hypothetical protein
MTTTKSLNTAALVAALCVLPACGSAHKGTEQVDLVAYTPSGSLVLFSPPGIDVYDGRLQNHIRHIPLGSFTGPPPLGQLRYSLSPDGTVGAVSYNTDLPGTNTRVALFRIPDGDNLAVVEIPDAATYNFIQSVRDLAVSPGGSLVYVNTSGNGSQGRMVDTATGALLWTSDSGWELPIWSADGTTLFAVSGDPSAANALAALDANTGAVKWQIDLSGTGTDGLALISDGALLTGPTTHSSTDPFNVFWSTADGTSEGELPPEPNTSYGGGNPHGWAGFACNATDTCALRVSEFHWAPQPQSNYVRIFKTDGTTLQTVPTTDINTQGSMAISPDGTLITIANSVGEPAGVKVYRVGDGQAVGALDM